MKRTLTILTLAAMLALAGCSTTNIAETIKAMGGDTNSVVVIVKSVYGSIEVYRNCPYLVKQIP